MDESYNLPNIRTFLEQYIDFDFVDRLASPKRKRDGHYYSTYLGVLRPEYALLAPERRIVVIKEIMPAQEKAYRSLSSIWSPYLETVYGVFPIDDFFIAINEFIPKPSSLPYSNEILREKHSLSLEDYINHFGCLSESEALIFLIQLCEGLETLRKIHLVHGDISPQNILLTDRLSICPCPYPKIKGMHHTMSIKIIDFDITKEQKGSEHLVTTVEGTRLFAAPEILDYQNPTDRVDLYSLGCILSYMMTGKSPKQLAPKELQKVCSPRVERIIKKCTLDYSRRYRNITLLKEELLTTLEVLSPSRFFYRIPGIQFGHPWHTCIVILIYNNLLETIVGIFIHQIDILGSLTTLLMPIFGLDLFYLGEHSRTYMSFRDKHPWIRIIIRILLGIVFPLVLSGILQKNIK